MTNSPPNVFTFQVGKGSQGKIDQLIQSATIYAADIPEAEKKAREEFASMQGCEEANLMLLLDDGQNLVWWRPVPSN